jgi:hypothetical protein
MIWNVYCGSKIRIFPSRIPDPGVKKAPAPGSGSATLIGRILEYVVTNAVFADSGCLSRIPNPDIYPSRILESWISDVVLSFSKPQMKYHKIETYFF